jgi:hypothetical protein
MDVVVDIFRHLQLSKRNAFSHGSNSAICPPNVSTYVEGRRTEDGKLL